MLDIDKIKEFMESEEGKESINRYAKKLQRKEEHMNRWVQKFKTRCESDLDRSIEKLIEKYNSDEYRDREYKKGFQPREKLLWIVWNYAKRYCKRCNENTYANQFTGEMYYVGSYIIQIMHGQGSILVINKNKSK
jgi:hypothetical protein